MGMAWIVSALVASARTARRGLARTTSTCNQTKEGGGTEAGLPC